MIAERARRLWDTCLGMSREDAQAHIRCPTLGLLTDTPGQDQLRSDIYDAIFNGMSRLVLKDPLPQNGTWRPKIASAAAFGGWDEDLSAARSAQQRLVLGALLGTVRDVPKADAESDKENDEEQLTCGTPRVVAPPSSQSYIETLFSEPTCFPIRLVPTPKVWFSTAVESGGLCLECTPACPAAHVSDGLSLWDCLYESIFGCPAPLSPEGRKPGNAEWHMVTVLGLPFFILTTKLDVPLGRGEDVVADRGRPWKAEFQRRGLAWLWVENMRLSGVTVPAGLVREQVSRATAQCRVCYGAISGEMAEACNCCGNTYHVSCLAPDEQKIVAQTHVWVCRVCRALVKACQTNVRYDDVALDGLTACRNCERGVSQNDYAIAFRCRALLGHLGTPHASVWDVRAQALRTISALTKALEASEARNLELHKMAQQKKENGGIVEEGDTVESALQFLKEYKTTCHIYEVRRQTQRLPKPEAEYSDASAARQTTMSFASVSRSSHSYRGRPSGGGERPQSIARGLLRGAFDPERRPGGPTFDSSIAFNEANMQAKRLRPWPRGISWNTKRLTWSVRFWDTDGRALVATSVPARKHGGVKEAFHKAVALRKKSYSNVLARVAAEVSAGRELPSLHWDRTESQWLAVDPATGATECFPATSEDVVYPTWVEALEWLSAHHDAAATATLMQQHPGTRPTPATSVPTTTSLSQRCCPLKEETGGDHAAAGAGDLLDDDDTEDTGHPETSATADTAALRSHQSVKTLQPFPPGLIWARTTSRFFAVFRDPSGSSLHRKKRFKTFDPKKYGGVHEAHEAAIKFLESVEPWVTQASAAAAAAAGGQRRAVGRRSHNTGGGHRLSAPTTTTTLQYREDNDDVTLPAAAGPQPPPPPMYEMTDRTEMHAGMEHHPMSGISDDDHAWQNPRATWAPWSTGTLDDETSHRRGILSLEDDDPPI